MKLHLGAIVAMLLAGAAVPARATDYLITYSGVVAQGNDSYGTILGAPGSLAGLSYTATYTLRIPTPTAIFTSDGVTTSEIKGGTSIAANVASPLSAILTINGVAVTFSGNALGQAGKVYASQLGMVDQIYDNVTSVDLVIDPVTFTAKSQFSGILKEWIVGHPGLSMFGDFDLTSPFTYAVQAQDNPTGSFQFFHALNGIDDAGANGTLVPQFVSVAALPDGAVPEPASWAMMISGFGLAGALVRRRSAGVGLAQRSRALV
jgi:hypothetical protein